MLPSLQSLTKKVLAKQCVPVDQYHVLKCCGLWWYDGPITFYVYRHKMFIRSTCFSEGIELNTVLMKAAKENNHDLIRLFAEWGADINYGLICAHTEHTRNLCRELGAKDRLDRDYILKIFFDTTRNKTDSNIILCHEMFSNNPNLKNVDNLDLREEIMWELRGLMEITYMLDHDNSFSNMLTKYWYAIAVDYGLKKAIHYFYQRYTHLHHWRLMCALFYNNVFDLHELYVIERVRMDIDEMMHIACVQDYSYAAIYYCFIMGANINQAMLVSIQNYNLGNMFFCIDLGANAFEEGKALAEQKENYLIADALSLKHYNPVISLLSVIMDPEKINCMLKNYHSINMRVFLDYERR
ncbi:pMGF360-11L [African swine fever virus]|uniref:Protein MGF 360-11L n=1 Tax=African swine fever virus (isolate Tick/Malawi/Lil 20-1/1983) TaxID=10500 RepID=36011_ASFM2|nr:RecName: Full=Protein MGF 360-11L [African swine fever virus Malawi LIL 20/1]AAA50536.1 multigene family 360 protein [African swine fever virus]WRY69297.1 pMGF360-11L [African swine fever virus]